MLKKECDIVMNDKENIAISLCKNNELYKLIHYRSLCESIQKEIAIMLDPLRQRVLRGYYLSQKINEELGRINKQTVININSNSDIVKNLQNMQDEISEQYLKLKNKLKENTVSEVDFDNEQDTTLLAMFDYDNIVKDFINIRMLYKNILNQTELPIELTQKYNALISYNNNRMSDNISSTKKIAITFSNYLKTEEIQNYLSEILQKAIEFRIAFKNKDNEDFLESHSNEEIKEWLDAKS